MPIQRDKKLIFIHIPKTAGTSICSSLNITEHLGHYTWEKYSLRRIWPTYTKFTIVRNPYTRLISNYYYAKMSNSYWHSSNENSQYQKHPDYYTLKDKNFNETLDLLLNNKLKHLGWNSQHEYVCDNFNIKVDYLIKYENLLNDLNLMLNDNKLNKLDNLDILNVSSKSSDINVSFFEKNLHLTAQINELYSLDFKIFKYKKIKSI